MNAASLQKPGAVPVAAAPAAPQGAAQAGITPASGQGFVPASSGGAQAPQAGAGPKAGPASDGSLPADQALAAIVQVMGEDYGEPFVGADGTVYMERKKPNVAGGSIAVEYVVVGKIDKATRRMKVNPAVLEQAKAKSAPERKLVKVDDQYVWQTFSKGEDGKVIAEVTPATDEELAAHQQQLAAQQAKQAAQAKLENRGDWQQKIGQVSQPLGIFSSTAQVISGLGAGPNPLTGRPGASWISGWILAQRLNGKAEGKLLPTWMQTGPVATALEWGLQAYGMLDMGNDIRVVRDYLGKAPPLPAVNPNAFQDLVKEGVHPAKAAALTQLGTEIRTPLGDKPLPGAASMQTVEGTGNTAMLRSEVEKVVDKAGKVTAGGIQQSAQLVPDKDLHKAFGATDPVQDGGLKAKAKVDTGVTKGLGMLNGLVQPAVIGASALNLVSSLIGVKNTIDTKGAQSLLDTQAGRGAVLGAATSASFLGLYVVPLALKSLGVAVPAIAAASSAVNIAQNVIGGVQMLNNYGLFGEKGFLNNDAFRAGFLIPPLTPIGVFAFWMKNRRKKAEAEQAKLQAAQQLAVQKIAHQRQMARAQLQSSGQVSGATQGKDGRIVVSTGVPTDPAKMIAALSAPPAGAPGAAAASAQAAAPAAQAAPPPAS